MYNMSYGLPVLLQPQMALCTHSEILPKNIAYGYFQVSMLEQLFALLTNTAFI